MAVYTEVSDEELVRFIDAYGLGELLSYKGIAEGVENTNYLVHTTKGTFILTIYEKRVDPDDLPFFLGLMEHLSARGVTCPLPVRDAKGDILNVLAGRHAALITFLEGMWPKRPKVAHCLELGKALARMHVAGQGFPLRRVNALGLQGWRPLFDEFAPTISFLDLARDFVRQRHFDDLARMFSLLTRPGFKRRPKTVHCDHVPDLAQRHP